MAEAAEILNQQPSSQRKFFCHLCNVEIQTVNADYTCPLCSGGFIEELPAPNSSSDQSTNDDYEMQDANGMDDLDIIRDEIASILMARDGGNRQQDDDEDLDGLLFSNSNVGNGGAGGSSASSVGSSGGSSAGVGTTRLNVGMARLNRRRPRVHNFERFDNVLLEILQTLSGGANTGGETPLGNASMFFMGNPGDYAWGREGIDTIVTQLLNQVDTTGPPPLSREKIDEIPNVEITQEQVDQKLQCSVCWEDFKIQELVRKLPCLHVYHENCIVPWLELHGTCPICRKSLTPEGCDSASLRNAASVFIRNSSLDDTNQQHNSTNTNNDENNSSRQQNTEQNRSNLGQLPDPANIFSNIIPFSRLFSGSQLAAGSQPGTSASTPFSQSLTITQNPTNFSITLSPQQQQSQNRILFSNMNGEINQRILNTNTVGTSTAPVDVATTSTSTATSSSSPSSTSALRPNNGSGASISQSNNEQQPTNNQNDVHKLDDGNIEYEFD